MANIKELVGKTFTSVVNTGDEIRFLSDTGNSYYLYHDQDCCESVYVEDVIGDLTDLQNTPILNAVESENEDIPDNYMPGLEEEQWTFYRISTIKGTVVIRFYGESDYYSTSVSFGSF